MIAAVQLVASLLALVGAGMATWYGLGARRTRIQTERQYRARLVALFATPPPPRPPSATLTAARARWEGKTVVCRDHADSWWGRGHRHRVERVNEGVPGDIVVGLECQDCERRGPVGLVLMDGWEIVES